MQVRMHCKVHVQQLLVKAETYLSLRHLTAIVKQCNTALLSGLGSGIVRLSFCTLSEAPAGGIGGAVCIMSA
jgi:hypothetical protein